MKNLLKVVSLVAAGVIVLVSTVAVLTPRVARAVAATLVHNVDSPPRNPWTANCVLGHTTSLSQSCSIPATAGYEITIQTVSLQADTSNNHEHLILTLVTATGNTNEIWTNQLHSVVGSLATSVTGTIVDLTGRNLYASAQPLTLYVDPTNSGSPNDIAAYINTDTNNPNGMAGLVTFVGYSVNLGASAAAN